MFEDAIILFDPELSILRQILRWIVVKTVFWVWKRLKDDPDDKADDKEEDYRS